MTCGALLLPTVAFSNALGQIAAGLLLIGALLSVFAAPANRPPARFALLLAGWVGACLVSALVALERDIAAHAFIGKTLDYTMTALAAATLMRSRRRTALALEALVWMAWLIGLDAGWQWIFRHDLLRNRPFISGHLTGPFMGTNNLASYLVMMLPLQCWWLMRHTGKAMRALMGASLLVELLVLAQTGSRSAWCGLFASLALLMVLVRRPSMAMIGVGFGFGLVLWSKSHHSWARLFSLDPGRAEAWHVAWHIFLDHPVLGIGLGTFMANYMPYVRVFAGDWSRPQYAHNCFLQILAEGGLVGFIAFSLPVGEAFRSVWRAVGARDPGTAFLAAALAAGVTACLVNAAFDTGLYSLSIAELFWYLLGLAAGLVVRPPAGAEVRSAR